MTYYGQLAGRNRVAVVQKIPINEIRRVGWLKEYAVAL